MISISCDNAECTTPLTRAALCCGRTETPTSLAALDLEISPVTGGTSPLIAGALSPAGSSDGGGSQLSKTSSAPMPSTGVSTAMRGSISGKLIETAEMMDETSAERMLGVLGYYGWAEAQEIGLAKATQLAEALRVVLQLPTLKTITVQVSVGAHVHHASDEHGNETPAWRSLPVRYSRCVPTTWTEDLAMPSPPSPSSLSPNGSQLSGRCAP